MTNLRYALITPARNEAAYIDKTIQSVICQSVLPTIWVVVSDSSTDGTDEIIRRHLREHKFMRLARRSGDKRRDFSSKVKAFNVGFGFLEGIDYDFLGNLDADVSFGCLYYESILNEFMKNKRLGIAGGLRYDKSERGFKKIIQSKNSVGGPNQLFRRQCFDAIGGYIPIEIGGEDALAEIMARMHGWEVEHFPEIKLFHYRATGTAGYGPFQAQWRLGIRDYALGYHPLFKLAKCFRRMAVRPLIVGSMTSFFGYFWAFLRKYERPVSDNFVSYLRREQISRLIGHSSLETKTADK